MTLCMSFRVYPKRLKIFSILMYGLSNICEWLFTNQ